MTSDVVYNRLRLTDPGHWRAVGAAWRHWAADTAELVAEITPLVVRLRAAWSGAAADAAVERLADVRRRLVVFRVLCWQADQAVSEFAAALERARALLARAMSAAARAEVLIDDGGNVRASVPASAAVSAIAADLSAALAVAERADTDAAARLGQVESALPTAPRPPDPARPGCTATPADVRRWWEALAPAERLWLLVAEAGSVAMVDGVPVTDRDAANRLLLDDRRAELDRALAAARGGTRRRLRGLRDGLAALSDRLADGSGPRAYLLRLDLAEEGRAVVALGDPDRADNVLTHVPGMTSDLASFGGELSRAERVIARAAELGPTAATSAVLWLDYDAPDAVVEAANPGRAEAAVPALRHFQDGLRASHDGPAARQTVLGHSYGSLVVGKAAAGAGMAADSVVFVGSPGVGVESAAQLRVPSGEVWSTTSRSDIIQYAPVAPSGLIRDLVVAAAVPVIGPLLAFGRPERDLWFGHNPSDAGFGARLLASQADAGHVGYWAPGRPALDALAAVTLGIAP